MFEDEAERSKQKASGLNNSLDFPKANDTTLWKTSNTSVLKRDWEETAPNVNRAGFSVEEGITFHFSLFATFSISFTSEKKK